MPSPTKIGALPVAEPLEFASLNVPLLTVIGEVNDEAELPVSVNVVPPPIRIEPLATPVNSRRKNWAWCCCRFAASRNCPDSRCRCPSGP